MKAFIDCGAWTGCSIEHALEHYPDHKIYAFECLPENYHSILSKHGRNDRVELYQHAVWIDNGVMKMYKGNYSQSGTIVKEKTANVNQNDTIDVFTIDLSSWIKDTFKPEDEIILKLNVEGAEYRILRKMQKDDTLKYIDKFFIQWHYNKMGMDKKTHQKIVRLVPNFERWEVMKKK